MRKFYLDILRISAIFGVVLIHAASHHYNFYAQLSAAQWLPHDVYHSIARWCVAVFFMMSGALLIPKQESAKSFFLKRYSRLLIVFLFWQVFYFWFLNHFPDLSTGYGWYRFFFEQAGYHLWFMNAILQVYLLIPIFQHLATKMSKDLLLYTIAVWLIPTAGLRLFEVLTGVGVTGYHLPARYLLDYGGFLLLGYYIDQHVKLKRSWNWPLAGVAIVCAVMITWLKWLWRGAVHSFADNNLGVHMIIFGVAIFLWCKNQEEHFQKFFSHPKIARIIKSLSECSFGIYLLHLIVLTWFQKNSYLNGSWPNGWLGVPMITVAIFVICWLTTALLRKIPLLKRLVA